VNDCEGTAIKDGSPWNVPLKEDCEFDEVVRLELEVALLVNHIPKVRSVSASPEDTAAKAEPESELKALLIAEDTSEVRTICGV
jgi:hypothetical protein